MKARVHGRGDAGVGLVELLIAITLLGIGAVAVLAGLTTTIRTSALHRSQTETTNALSMAAENLTSIAYENCPSLSTGPYADAVASAPGAAVTIQSIHYWNGLTFAAGNPCLDTNSAVPAELRIQLVTIQATVSNQSNPWVVDVIKRAD